MTEVEEMIAVGVNAQHPRMRMICRSKFLAKFSDCQRLSTYIDAGVIEKQLIHQLLGYQIMHIRWSLYQYLIQSKFLHDVECHMRIRCFVTCCDHDQVGGQAVLGRQ